MENICFCCKKNIEGFSVDLTDGCLCIECYEKVKLHNSRITHRNIGMYSGEEIMNIINPATNDNKVEATPEQSTASPELPNEETKYMPEKEDVNSGTKSSPFGIIKTVGWTILAIVLIICVINPGFLEEIAMKVLNKSNAVYIEKVQTLKPFNNTSYYEAFEGEFDNNEWSYFKSDEKHIVQVVSTYNDIDDKMITQFLLTPQGKDQFYIEPYAISVSGVNLSVVERNLVISELFKGDLSEAIFEALLYGN